MPMVVYWRREIGRGAFAHGGGDFLHAGGAGIGGQQAARGDDAVNDRQRTRDDDRPEYQVIGGPSEFQACPGNARGAAAARCRGKPSPPQGNVAVLVAKTGPLFNRIRRLRCRIS